jgi:membrane protein
MFVRNAWRLGRQTVNQYLDHGGPLLGAALAFWTILSVAPLMLIVLSIIRWVLGDAATQNDLPGQLSVAVEPHAADWVEQIVHNLQRSEAGPGAGIIGTLLLLWSASRLFRQMQDALNQLWRIRRESASVKENVVTSVQRASAAMAMVFILGGTLVLAIVLSTLAAALRGALGESLPGSHFAWSTLTVGVSMSLLSALFTVLYRLLPDARVAWKDCAVGACVTALIFCASEYPLSYYLGSQGIDSAFGAAGSLVTFLLWVYYCAQVFFLGAQFTAVYAESRGRGIRPMEGARVVREEAIAQPVTPTYAHDIRASDDHPHDGPSRPMRSHPAQPATARASASSNSGSRL